MQGNNPIVCVWCGKSYRFQDSTSTKPAVYCSIFCQNAGDDPKEDDESL